MKLLYIESKLKNQNMALEKSELAKLPKKLFLAYTIQYKDLAKSIKKQLEANNIKIKKFQQVLGCSRINTNFPVFFVGTGKFHSLNLYFQTPEIYILESREIIKVPKKDIDALKTRLKSSLIRFLSGKNIGILITTKLGQKIDLAESLKLKQKLAKKGKESFIFISDNINSSQFENFNIDSWINTACPGLALDNPNIINYQDLPLI